MKIMVMILFGLLLFPPLQSCTMEKNSAAPQWKNLSEAVEIAASSKKIILVDVYTDWCGWCKRMDAEVYADTAVRDYLRQNFITAKLNAESADNHTVNGHNASERMIAQSWGITGYPATVFLNSNAEPITVVPGYIPKETFLRVLEYIHTESYKTVSWENFLSSKTG